MLRPNLFDCAKVECQMAQFHKITNRCAQRSACTFSNPTVTSFCENIRSGRGFLDCCGSLCANLDIYKSYNLLRSTTSGSTASTECYTEMGRRLRFVDTIVTRS